MQLSFVIQAPDDFHLHLRDGEKLASVVPATSRVFARAAIMPNLTPPITTIDSAIAYKQRILQQVPAGCSFMPLMTLYLTNDMPIATVIEAAQHPAIIGAKLYPAGATTNSHAGVSDIASIYPLLAAMEECGLPLLVHGELPDFAIDVFDREARFIEAELSPISHRFPQLKIVLEHITTKDAVDFINSSSPNLAATITPHHMLYNRNHLLAGGVRPHFYCLPILKRELHREALVAAATSGLPRFFAGTDSAPHSAAMKENACGCAGIYNAPCALETYAEIFDAAIDLAKPTSQAIFAAFMSLHGANFYGLAQNSSTITLTRKPMLIPNEVAFGSETLIPMRAGEMVAWSVEP